VTRVARLLLAVALLTVPTSASADEAIWTLLKSGGQVVIMRHVTTVPNVPDTLGSGCATQRNLSEAGREDARRIGAAGKPFRRIMKAQHPVLRRIVASCGRLHAGTLHQEI